MSFESNESFEPNPQPLTGLLRQDFFAAYVMERQLDVQPGQSTVRSGSYYTLLPVAVHGKEFTKHTAAIVKAPPHPSKHGSFSEVYAVLDEETDVPDEVIGVNSKYYYLRKVDEWSDRWLFIDASLDDKEEVYDITNVDASEFSPEKFLAIAEPPIDEMEVIGIYAEAIRERIVAVESLET